MSGKTNGGVKKKKPGRPSPPGAGGADCESLTTTRRTAMYVVLTQRVMARG